MNEDKLYEFGWFEWRTTAIDSCSKHWFMRVPSKYNCCLNEDREGLQLELRKYVSAGFVGWDVHTSAELPNEMWPNFTIGVENEAELVVAVKLIVAAWEKMNEELNNS